MPSPHADRWTVFLLSVAVPGAGQLYAGRRSCVAWFLAAACLSSGTALLVPLGPALAVGTNFVLLALLGWASARHARRCLDRRSTIPSRITCETGHGPAVRLQIDLDVPRPPAVVWRQVADFSRFVCVDPFHSRVFLDPELRPGAAIALEHRAFGVTFWRFGRLLTWREGHGYAFSDLSSRGPHHGFPHVFFVNVLPTATGNTCLQVRVCGKWTAGWVPQAVRRWWLRSVCAEHGRLLAAHFSEDDA